MTSERTTAGGLVAGRYALRAQVGRGGMGVVWRAEDQLLGRDVALKRVGLSPGGLSPDTARAAREARLAATLNHPHVVAVFDLAHHRDERYADAADEQWLVMEYVEGPDLARLVAERGPLTPDEAGRLLHQAADALAAAHRVGIVHRDVKPSNILVTADGQVKLTDFGIARGLADATLTATGLMTGSPAYLAPEVASGASARPASDVWSLGATLFHALTGRPPYDVAGNVVGALYRIVHEEPPRPADAGWLTPLLHATMARDPQDRWTMAEVAEFLAAGPSASTPTVATRPAVSTSETLAMAPLLEPAPQPAPQPAPRPAAQPAPQPAPPRAPARAPRLAGPTASTTSTTSTAEPRGRSGWPVALAALALVGAAAGGWALLDEGDGRRPAASAGSTPGASGTPSPSPSASSPTPSAEPTPSAGEMRTFVADYLAAVTSEPERAWESLTPRFQRASGGLDDYRSWWSRVSSARLDSVTADPEALRVSYAVTYRMVDGSTSSDTVTLDLVMDGDRYLVADES